VIALAPSAGAGAAVTPPANDNFANAIAITSTFGSRNGTTVGATRQSGEPIATAGHSVWYSYTATATGTFVVDACSDVARLTIVNAFKGSSVSSLVAVGTSDSTCGAQGRLRIDVTPGVVIRLSVGVFNGGGEAFTLRWQFATSAAPLIDFGSDPLMNCTTASIASDWLQFFSSDADSPRPLSCATLVSVAGVGLFGPIAFGDRNGFVGTQRLHPYAPFAQLRTATQVKTAVALPGTTLALVQTETYTGGTSVQVDIELRNNGSPPADAIIYRTGDCFPGADLSFAIVGNGFAGCESAQEHALVARPAPASTFIRFEPTAGSSRFAAGDVVGIRNAIAARTPLGNSCECSTAIDAAAALSWSVHTGAHASAFVGHRLTMSTGAGRDVVDLAPQLLGRSGHWTLSATLTDNGHPVPGQIVVFRRGETLVCAAVSTVAGIASCTTGGRTAVYEATYFGDALRQPAIESFGRADPHPGPPGPNFPACARFSPFPNGPTAALGDGHFFEVLMPTQAPTCPTVTYRALRDGVPIGELPGNLIAVGGGTQKTGSVFLYIAEPLDAGISGCITVQSIDPRAGAVIDRAPEPTDPDHCLPAVGGQKFR
jgi:hypothetical protein